MGRHTEKKCGNMTLNKQVDRRLTQGWVMGCFFSVVPFLRTQLTRLTNQQEPVFCS